MTTAAAKLLLLNLCGQGLLIYVGAHGCSGPTIMVTLRKATAK